MIVIDDRSGSCQLVTRPPLNDPEVATLGRLDSADASFIGNGPSGEVTVGVEVKSVSDLISSTANNRLGATQIPAMLENYDHSWLLVYGRYRCSKDGELMVEGGKWSNADWRPAKLGQRRILYSYLEGFLYDVQMAGIHVHRCEDLDSAAQWLYVLYHWWSRPWKSHKALRSFDNSKPVSPRLQGETDKALLRRAELASKLPAIGFERAVAAAKHFRSIHDLINASAEEWEEVEGIRKTIARSVVTAIHERSRGSK